jgi:hypothetical protein
MRAVCLVTPRPYAEEVMNLQLIHPLPPVPLNKLHFG